MVGLLLMLAGAMDDIWAMRLQKNAHGGEQRKINERLWNAIETGKVKDVRGALNARADIDAENENGHTSLTYALSLMYRKKCNNEIALLLIARKAQIDKTKGGDVTPLMIAASAGDREMVQCLLERKACIDRVNAKGETALMLAASAGNTEMVQCLFERKACIDSVSLAGETVLAQAVKQGNEGVVRLLLAYDVAMDYQCDGVMCAVEQKTQDPSMLELLADERKARMILGDRNWIFNEDAASDILLALLQVQVLVDEVASYVMHTVNDHTKNKIDARVALRRGGKLVSVVAAPVAKRDEVEQDTRIIRKTRTVHWSCVCSVSVEEEA